MKTSPPTTPPPARFWFLVFAATGAIGALWFQLNRMTEEKTPAPTAQAPALPALDRTPLVAAAVRNDKAMELAAHGRLEEAEAAFYEVLAIRERILGMRHYETLATRAGLAAVWSWQGRFRDAMAEFCSVLAIRERELGSEHPDIALVLYDIAVSLDYQKKPYDALSFAKRALKILEKALGREHVKTKEAEALVKRLEKISAE
ncbi:MAG: tetratricopeptide repeat protein [Chthoniobacteraceae bacterium]